MNGRRTALDTNILVYAFDPRDPVKRERAAGTLSHGRMEGYLLGLQVIGEFYAVVTRRKILTPARAVQEIEYLAKAFETFLPTERAYRDGAREAAGGRFSYWDAVLLISAQEAKCDILLSEDMADGARLGGVTVRNPFGPRGLNEEACAFLGTM